MPVDLVEQAPHVRCYKCGVSRIATVCHHCGRPMCARHTPPVADGTGRLLSVEFAGLGLGDTKCGEGSLHCDQCAHVVRRPDVRLAIAGLMLTLVAIAVSTRATGVGLVAIVAGIGLVTGGGYTVWWRIMETRRTRPPLPALPRFDRVQVQEVVRGEIIVDPNGEYRASQSSVEGELTIVTTMAKPERQRLDQYRKRYRLKESDEVVFHQGFAVLRGALGLEFLDGDTNGDHAGPVIALTGSANTQPFLCGSDGARSGERRVTRRYRLLDGSTPTQLPIRLIPSLDRGAAQRKLDLELQWVAVDSERGRPAIKAIELLELRVPTDWGKVEQSSGSAVIGTSVSATDENRGVWTITWRRPTITDDARRSGRRVFSVSFENSLDLSDSISGRAELVFDETLSGLNGVSIHYPLGGVRDEEKAEIKTHVVVDFTLSLADLRYHDIRIVPDPKNVSDRERKETRTFDNVLPDHRTVIALMDALSEEHFYVKRVIENPPREGARAHLINRLWDIAGRYYLGVYPIDFHLILTGEEMYSGEIRTQTGVTRTTLTVQGTYANRAMETKIEETWERLNDLIVETLTGLSKTAALSVGAATGAAASGRAILVQEQLDRLFIGFMEGRMSEELFLQLKTGLDDELRELRSGS